MTIAGATRSSLLELRDERRAMGEGYSFLDEKCLLLAAEILRELRRYAALLDEFRRLHGEACAGLRGALLRHGLQGVECMPAPSFDEAQLQIARRALLGVTLQDAELGGTPASVPTPVNPSPEAERARERFAALLAQAAPLAAAAGNLERLSHEYRRTVRRARALHDVLLPELDQSIHAIAARLEQQEQEEAVWVRHGR
ncbi:V-type ATP synthase subunit D [Ramlibacter sp. 2FC]|uniref:V-type ATP synthase subunit D n=1 Tax=Ramlibacter sp. 2FC TaxID=2502188 RepID=UPI0010F482F8|nr:V-type ATP synthase subunit D [Ramlibacter sp. 2FC]